MSYTITSECIKCDRCVSACPTNAIKRDGDRYWIDSKLCNNCVGYYSVAQCAAGCPTANGCISSPNATLLLNSTDYWERWEALYNRMVYRLHNAEQVTYWERWFSAYSQEWSQQLQRKPVRVQS